MHRIDGAGATVDNKFTQGNPAGGVPATVVTDAWLNSVQEEIAGVIEAEGIVLNPAQDGQLLEAMSRRAVQVISTMAVLRTIAGNQNRVLFLSGYTSRADGGQGVFFWNAAYAGPDNGGVNIIPTGHVGNGCWQRMVGAFVTFEHFGADRSGVAVSDAAFQACVNYISSSSGRACGTVGATYRLTTQIDIPAYGLGGGRIIDIDGCGASVLPDGIAGSVFRSSVPHIDYQTSIKCHDWVVASTNFNNAVQTPLQAYSFIEFNGGGFQNCSVKDIRSKGIVCMGAVVWFSDVNTGYADGLTVEDINFEYASQTFCTVAITKRAGGSADPRGNVHAHTRFINCAIATDANAVDFRSWETALTRGGGKQSSIYLDGVWLEDSNIGPWIIGNPYAIYCDNGATIAKSDIDQAYCELYQAVSVFGAAGHPYAISGELHSCVVKHGRLYFDAVSFAGSARLYKGKAINTRFEKPAVSKIGSALVSTDKFIEFSVGSTLNHVDAWELSHTIAGVTTDSYYPHPSQHVQNNGDPVTYNNFRQANNLGLSVASGQSWSAAASRLLTTIPRFHLNSNDLIKVTVGVRSTATGAGAVLNLSNLIGGAGGNSGNVTLNSASGAEAILELLIRFTGGADKVYITSAGYYVVGANIKTGVSPATSFNGGSAYAAVDIVNNDMQIWLNVFSISDGVVELVTMAIEHRSGTF